MLRHTKKDIPAKIPPMNVHLAVTRVRDQAWAKFDESFEVAVNLGVDPRKPGQSVKVSAAERGGHYFNTTLENGVVYRRS